MHCLIFQLDGLLNLAGLPEEELQPYHAVLDRWYCRLAESPGSKISSSADFMRASRYIRNGDYDKAQEILNVLADKRMLQKNRR